jgi:hypothetical protein
MKEHTLIAPDGGKLVIRVGDHYSRLREHISLKKHNVYKEKLGKSNFLMHCGSLCLLQIGLDERVSDIHAFATERDKELFNDELTFAALNLKVNLHVLERLQDRYTYTAKYTIKGLLGTTMRAVKKSRIGFKTQSGKVIRVYGKHLFVVVEDRVVTLLPHRPEFKIYIEAYKRSRTPMPDILVSKYIGEKADAIYLQQG